ncbi:hypothetical protein C0J52_08522 [Blattella germanica]|nr:hypothetical protein C0J52_08522 [Blattella germanica]
MAEGQSDGSQLMTDLLKTALLELEGTIRNTRDDIKREVSSFTNVLQSCVKLTDTKLQETLNEVKYKLPLTVYCKKNFIFGNTQLDSQQVHLILLRAVKELKVHEEDLDVEATVRKLEEAMLEYGDNLENSLYFAGLASERHFEIFWRTFENEAKAIDTEIKVGKENTLKASIIEGVVPIVKSANRYKRSITSLWDRTTEVEFLKFGSTVVAYYKPGRYVGPQDNTLELYEAVNDQSQNVGISKPSIERHQNYSQQLLDARSNFLRVSETIEETRWEIVNSLESFEAFFKNTIKSNLLILVMTLSDSKEAVIQILSMTLRKLLNVERPKISPQIRKKMEENLLFTVTKVLRISESTNKILEKLGPIGGNDDNIDNIENIEKESVVDRTSNLIERLLHDMEINITVQNLVLMETLKRKVFTRPEEMYFSNCGSNQDKSMLEDLLDKITEHCQRSGVPCVIREILSADIHNSKLYFTNIQIETKNMMKLILERALKSLGDIESIIFVHLFGLERCAEVLLSAWKCYIDRGVESTC